MHLSIRPAHRNTRQAACNNSNYKVRHQLRTTTHSSVSTTQVFYRTLHTKKHERHVYGRAHCTYTRVHTQTTHARARTLQHRVRYCTAYLYPLDHFCSCATPDTPFSITQLQPTSCCKRKPHYCRRDDRRRAQEATTGERERTTQAWICK